MLKIKLTKAFIDDFRMGSMTSINSGSINIGMDLSEEERKKFSDTMREMLAEMEPVCQEEQSFIINFFHLTGENTNIPIYTLANVSFPRQSSTGKNCNYFKYYVNTFFGELIYTKIYNRFITYYQN